MFTVSDFREIISGQRTDWRAAVARGLLSIAEPIYRSGICLRNWRYDRGAAVIHRVDVPVVSVGNITGGTGKTPLVAWIAQFFCDRQRHVALVSRGYGARSGVPNDEAMELAALLPDVPHLQNPDRVAAAPRAISELHAEIILLDDAFQHRRLHRDLNILLIDALEPFGFEYLLPRGLLREPLFEMRRAEVIAISRADLVTSVERSELLDRVRALAPRAMCMELAHRPQALVNSANEQFAVSVLKGQRIAAFCGIGNPRGFRETLLHCGAEIISFREFSDHFQFGKQEQQSLDEWLERLEVDQVVCTMKDFVKLRVPTLGRRPLRALTIGIEFLSGRDDFTKRLMTIGKRDADARF